MERLVRVAPRMFIYMFATRKSGSGLTEVAYLKLRSYDRETHKVTLCRSDFASGEKVMSSWDYGTRQEAEDFLYGHVKQMKALYAANGYKTFSGDTSRGRKEFYLSESQVSKEADYIL